MNKKVNKKVKNKVEEKMKDTAINYRIELNNGEVSVIGYLDGEKPHVVMQFKDIVDAGVFVGGNIISSVRSK